MDRDDEIDPRYELKLGAGQMLPEAIADKIRELVDSGMHKPGSRLPNESELARKMGVARSSVRTALQTLAVRGVCEVKRGVGWYVSRTPVPAVDGAAGRFASRRYPVAELLEMRIALEGLAASLAAVRMAEGEIDEVAKYNEEHFAAAQAEDRDELLRTDLAFHESIVKGSRNDLLFEYYQQVVGKLTDWRYESYAERGVALRSAREHAKVVRFLRNHDQGGARAAMNGHLHRLYDGLPEIEGEPLDSTDSGLGNEPEWPNR
jgi:GntR family transcriptional repressor for pyruvate dehydrogenase complex